MKIQRRTTAAPRVVWLASVTIVVGIALGGAVAISAGLEGGQDPALVAYTALWLGACCGGAVAFIVARQFVTELRRAFKETRLALSARERQLHYLALHDIATGLPTRLLFEDRLAQALARAAQRKCMAAVLMLDLNDFKRVNDTLGHQTGDRLLMLAAHRLRARVRSSDIVARLGGDEFGIVVRDLQKPGDATRIALELVAAFAEPFALGNRQVHVDISAGLSLFPRDGLLPDELLQKADEELYHAKARGEVAWADGKVDRHGLPAAELDWRRPYLPAVEHVAGFATGLLRWHH